MLTNVKNLDFKLLNQLDDRSLVNVCLTNKQAKEICDDQDFWLQRILIKFPYIPLEVFRKNKGDRTWSEYYIDDLRKINKQNKELVLTVEAKNGRLDYVMIALNSGVDIHTENDFALRHASDEGHLDVVKFLVEKGADIHAQDDYALRIASRNGYLEVVKFLVHEF
jgi:ankyrin repeat protein